MQNQRYGVTQRIVGMALHSHSSRAVQTRLNTESSRHGHTQHQHNVTATQAVKMVAPHTVEQTLYPFTDLVPWRIPEFSVNTIWRVRRRRFRFLRSRLSCNRALESLHRQSYTERYVCERNVTTNNCNTTITPLASELHLLHRLRQLWSSFPHKLRFLPEPLGKEIDPSFVRCTSWDKLTCLGRLE